MIGKDAIQYIAELGVKASGVTRPDQFPADTFLQDGQARLTPTRPRRHSLDTVASLRDFVANVESHKATDLAADQVFNAVAFVAFSGITITDDTRRRDWATLLLRTAPQFALVSDPNFRTPRGQREWIKALRVDLDGCLRDDGAFLSRIRRLSFASGKQSTSEVRIGKETTSRSLNAELAGADNFPEQIILHLPVWANADLRDISVQPVRCVIDLDLLAETIALIPIPADMEQAKHAALSELASSLADIGIPLYRGSY